MVPECRCSCLSHVLCCIIYIFGVCVLFFILTRIRCRPLVFFYFTRYFRFSFMGELSLLRVSGGETGFRISDPFGRGYGPSITELSPNKWKA